MSVRPADAMYVGGYAPVNIPSEPARPEGRAPSFQDAFAASVAKKRESERGGKDLAKAAEMLHLEMMRTALSLDGHLDTLPAPGTTGNAGLRAAFAARGTGIDPASLLSALSASAGSNGTAAPDQAAVRSGTGHGVDPSSLTDTIDRASRCYGVDARLIKAVIQVESNFNPMAVSPAGAQGLMQLMPSTAAGLGVSDSFNAEQNIMAGTRFLKDMLNRYGGDLDRALAAYNWGPGNLDRGKGHLPLETREYLVKVKKWYQDFSAA